MDRERCLLECCVCQRPVAVIQTLEFSTWVLPPLLASTAYAVLSCYCGKYHLYEWWLSHDYGTRAVKTLRG